MSENKMIEESEVYKENENAKKKSTINLYADLGPIDDLDDNNASVQALDWAIRRDDLKDEDKKRVTNIAISGPYGSGKSSIINSYLHNKKNKDIREQSLKVSLIGFAKESNRQAISKITSREFEETFLRQLFYADGENFYKNRKNRARKLEENVNGVWTAIGIVIICLLATVLYYSNLRQMYFDFCNTYNVNECVGSIILFLLVSGSIIGGAVALYKMMPRIFSLWKYGRIKLGSMISLELSNDETTIFNRLLDDIFLFFKSSSYRYIFIEDLDRVNNIEIFIHLRNLNFILNNSKDIEERIVFIYAIKDDLFKGEERTKFFDFIIPVVPVVGIGNTDNILYLKIKEKRLEKTLDKRFVIDIASYIDNMRIMDNIINEFIVYREALKSKSSKSKIYDKNLFAIITYKNLYPDRFIENLVGRGELKKIFESKDALIETIRDEMLEDDSKRVHQEDYEDVNRAYLNQRLKTYKELLTIADRNDITYKFTDNSLLSHFIRRGYIDENYYVYLTKFEGGIFSEEDRNFIQNVNSNNKERFDIPLKGVDEILHRLQDEDFDKEAILNYDLLNALFKNPIKNRDRIWRMIKHVQNDNDRSIEFITRYIDVAIHREEFIRVLANDWNRLYYTIENSNKVIDKKKEVILLLLINNMSSSEIKTINLERCISNAIIRNQNDILNDKDLIPERLYSAINSLGIYFDSIPQNIRNKSTIEVIVKSDEYTVSRDNLDIIIRNLLDERMRFSHRRPRYITWINRTNNISLKNRIRMEMRFFVENVLSTGENYDLKEDVNELIRYWNKDPVLCERIIMSEHNKLIHSLREAERKYGIKDYSAREIVFRALMINENTDYSWENIYLTWQACGHQPWLRDIIYKKTADPGLHEFLSEKDFNKEFIAYVRRLENNIELY